jgi:ATP-dependent RNA helicase DDX41
MMHYHVMVLKMDSACKRRVQRSHSPVYNVSDDNDAHEPYIPVAQRREQTLARLSSLGVNTAKAGAKKQQDEQDERIDAQKEEERRREKSRKERTLLMEAQEVHSRKAAEG